MEASSNQADIISSLSDSILIHILSFLPSKLSGQTCILSRRWRHLWEYVPELKFYDCTDAQLFSFLTHRKSSKLKTFHVSMRRYCYRTTKYTIDQALWFCSTQGVEELHLSFSSYCSRYCLTAKILSCWGTSLRVLHLRCCLVSCHLKINLPKVEELHLSDVLMEVGAFDNIITGCPYVESFEISHCGGVSVLRFHLPNLKRLMLYWCHNLEHINVSVPNLKFFKHNGEPDSLKTFQMRVENLKEAQFSLFGYRKDDSHVQGYRQLFQAAAQAEHLEVDCSGVQETFELYHLFNMNLPCKNVKSLALKRADLVLLPVVPAIMGLLPGLENLELSLFIEPPLTPELRKDHYLMSGLSEEKELCMHLKDTKRRIDCLSYSLRRIDVQHFEARNTQIELIKLLLQNASVLEVICFTDSYGSIARLLKSRHIFTSCAANKNTKFLDQNNINRHSNVRSW